MPVGRRIGLVIVLAAGLAGCRAGGAGSLSFLPRRNPSPTSFDVDAFVAEHNRNAEAIQSLQSKPTIEVSRGRVYRVSVNGHMALERPRNFALQIDAEGVKKADIGSNAEEFWYWVANPDKDEKWIYWCSYRELPTSDLPVTYQPDWIIEAMGLEPITREEADTIKVGRGEAGTTLLTFAPVRDRGAPYIREMLVSNTDRRIRKLRIFTESPRVLIAEAQADDFQAYPTGKTGSADGETCHLPRKLWLHWIREQLVLNVAMTDLTVNQFDHAMAADIFVEPEMTGYQRMNLAELNRGARPDRRTRTRQTMPPPDSGEDVDLGRPAPMKDDGPVVPKVGRRVSPPAPDSEEQPLPTFNDLVGPPIPRPPGNAPPQSAALPGIPGRDSTIEQ